MNKSHLLLLVLVSLAASSSGSFAGELFDSPGRGYRQQISDKLPKIEPKDTGINFGGSDLRSHSEQIIPTLPLGTLTDFPRTPETPSQPSIWTFFREIIGAASRQAR